MEYLIDAMLPGDWPAVLAVYLEGINTGMATFETTPPDWEKWNSGHMAACRLVARQKDGTRLGWAALSPVSSRCVYAGVGEVSIYVAQAARRQGVGRTLLQALIETSEQAGLWTLQAGIMADNQASIYLHESAGFRMVGRREKIGKLNGAWRDTVLMERRSLIVGIE
jgi:L-amino acid N-acyltransferase YncA